METQLVAYQKNVYFSVAKQPINFAFERTELNEVQISVNGYRLTV